MKKLFVVLMLLVAMNVNAQWVQISSLITYGDAVTCFIENNGVYFAGSLNNPNPYAGNVYRSTNNCVSWTLTSLQKRTYALIIVGNNIFAGTYETGIYVSSNNGDNWTQTTLNDKTIESFAVSGNNIFAGSSFSGIYISTNDGISWTQTSMINNYFLCFAVDGNNLFAGGGGVHLTSNNGSNWTNLGLNQEVYSTLIIGNTIFAGTWSNLFISTNYGLNWVRQNICYPDVYSIVKLENNIFIGGSEGVFLTTNNGLSWANKNQGFGNYPYANVLLISNNYIYAGVGSTFWRRAISEITNTQSISIETPSKYSLSQNYPNPFNPTTNIKFSILNSGDVKLVVYDIMGKEVQTLVNERLQPGTYETSLDGSNLNSGVYFYKMMTNNFAETKRMFLIK